MSYPPSRIGLALTGSSLSSEEGRSQLWSHLLLIHNFNPAWIFALNGVFWSIAVEVQLYLLYPLLWKLRARWGIAGALKFTTGALCAAALAANCTAGFWLEYSVLAQITPGKVRLFRRALDLFGSGWRRKFLGAPAPRERAAPQP